MNTPSQGLSPISPRDEQQGCGGSPGFIARPSPIHSLFFFLSGLQPPLHHGGLDACSPFGTQAGWRLTPASPRPRPQSYGSFLLAHRIIMLWPPGLDPPSQAPPSATLGQLNLSWPGGLWAVTFHNCHNQQLNLMKWLFTSRYVRHGRNVMLINIAHDLCQLH